VDSNLCDIDQFLENITNRWLVDGPLSALGELRRCSELHGLATELIIPSVPMKTFYFVENFNLDQTKLQAILSPNNICVALAHMRC
jgi:hypothetical protein